MASAPRRILITGATGFVGCHLTARLAAAHPQAALHTPSIDVRDAEEVATAVQEASPDVCIHLAAVSTVRGAERNEEDAWDVNLRRTNQFAFGDHMVFVIQSCMAECDPAELTD